MATLLAVIRAEGRARRGLPAAIAIAVLTLTIAALAGCDPGYGFTIRNDTNVTLMLSGRDIQSERLEPGQEVGYTPLEVTVEKYERRSEPAVDFVVTDPKGRQLHITRTKADLEAAPLRGGQPDLTIVIRNEDFASLTPTAPK